MDKTDFIKEAIKDTQGTIRAVDVKVGALLVGLLTPIANTHRVFAHIDHLVKHQPICYLSWVVVFLFVVTWLLALFALVRAISVTDDPRHHIINSGDLKGSFYGGSLYSPQFLDVFLERSILKASKDPKSYLDSLPSTPEDIEAELVFEHMKIVFIRQIKFNRLKWGLRLSLVWLTIGVIIYLWSRYAI